MSIPEYVTRTGSVASIFSLCFFLLDNVANVIYLCAFCTQYWSLITVDDTYYVYNGLWSQCNTFTGQCLSLVGNEGVPVNFLACQFMACLVFIVAAIKTLLSIFYIFKKDFCKETKIAILTATFALLTALTATILLFVYVEVINEWMDTTFEDFPPEWVQKDITYSYYVAVVSVVLFYCSAVCMLLELCLYGHVMYH